MVERFLFEKKFCSKRFFNKYVEKLKRENKEVVRFVETPKAYFIVTEKRIPQKPKKKGLFDLI